MKEVDLQIGIAEDSKVGQTPCPTGRRRDPKFPVTVEQLQSGDLKGFDNTSLVLDRVSAVHRCYFKQHNLRSKLYQESVLRPSNFSARWRCFGASSLS